MVIGQRSMSRSDIAVNVSACSTKWAPTILHVGALQDHQGQVHPPYLRMWHRLRHQRDRIRHESGSRPTFEDRLGSIASLWPRAVLFRFTPVNGHRQTAPACLTRARSRHRPVTLLRVRSRRQQGGIRVLEPAKGCYRAPRLVSNISGTAAHTCNR